MANSVLSVSASLTPAAAAPSAKASPRLAGEADFQQELQRVRQRKDEASDKTGAPQKKEVSRGRKGRAKPADARKSDQRQAQSADAKPADSADGSSETAVKTDAASDAAEPTGDEQKTDQAGAGDAAATPASGDAAAAAQLSGHAAPTVSPLAAPADPQKQDDAANTESAQSAVQKLTNLPDPQLPTAGDAAAPAAVAAQPAPAPADLQRALSAGAPQQHVAALPDDAPADAPSKAAVATSARAPANPAADQSQAVSTFDAMLNQLMSADAGKDADRPAGAQKIDAPPPALSIAGTPQDTPRAAAHTRPAAAAPLPPEIEFAQANYPKLIDNVRTQLLPGGGAMQIRLDPPELGALQVSVEMRDGAMVASFQTSSDQATQLLSHSLHQLKSALESQGVTVEKLQVTQAPRDQHFGGQENSQNQQQSQEQASQQEQQRRELMRRMWRKAMGRDAVDFTV